MAYGTVRIKEVVADIDKLLGTTGWKDAPTSVHPVVAAPAAADSAGVAGTIHVVDGFIYACIATDTWQRVAIATWA